MNVPCPFFCIFARPSPLLVARVPHRPLLCEAYPGKAFPLRARVRGRSLPSQALQQGMQSDGCVRRSYTCSRLDVCVHNVLDSLTTLFLNSELSAGLFLFCASVYGKTLLSAGAPLYVVLRCWLVERGDNFSVKEPTTSAGAHVVLILVWGGSTYREIVRATPVTRHTPPALPRMHCIEFLGPRLPTRNSQIYPRGVCAGPGGLEWT